MSQTFDTDVAAKLQPVLELGRDNVFKELRAGLEGAVEVAKESGSTKLQQTAESALDGTEAVVKVFESLFDCGEKYMEYLKRLDAAM